MSKRRKAIGKLPSDTWLDENGYGELKDAMKANPQAFAHITQERSANSRQDNRDDTPVILPFRKSARRMLA